MVRLVSAKPPKIDGVEGGSATPSSTPTPTPKVSTWDQVEERQQRRRGMPKPTKPVPSLNPEVPSVRPDGATPPPGAPKPELKGEMPDPTKFGSTVLRTTRLPDGTSPLRFWKGEMNYEGLGFRPADAGKGVPVLTTAQKFGARVLPFVEQIGSPNPLRGLRSGNAKGVLPTVLSAAAFSGAQGAMLREQLVEGFIADQYPKDLAEEMADAYILAYTPAGATMDVTAQALADASFMGASAALGAGIGAAFFGIGAIPGAAAGAAAGWAASRVVAGASAIINLFEAALSAGSVGAGTQGVGEGKMVNLPSIDDFWFHGGFDENGNQRNGLLGWNFRAGGAEVANNAALFAARAVVDAKHPGRFLTDDQAIEETKRIKSGYYATHSDVDPKYDDYKSFIQEGYFVYKDNDGKFKVNVEEVQTFLLNSVRYTQEADLRTFLPPKTAVGDQFYKSQYLTDDMLATMWDIPEVMP